MIPDLLVLLVALAIGIVGGLVASSLGFSAYAAVGVAIGSLTGAYFVTRLGRKKRK